MANIVLYILVDLIFTVSHTNIVYYADDNAPYVAYNYIYNF